MNAPAFFFLLFVDVPFVSAAVHQHVPILPLQIFQIVLFEESVGVHQWIVGHQSGSQGFFDFLVESEVRWEVGELSFVEVMMRVGYHIESIRLSEFG